MQYNPLGKTDLRVSRLCLGCMTFGEPDRGNHAWTLPEESSRPIIKRALEGGINFFDTANSYSDGSSVSAWAESAMLWATQNGIISGIDGMLTPQGQATRAQFAVMLYRFWNGL